MQLYKLLGWFIIVDDSTEIQDIQFSFLVDNNLDLFSAERRREKILK